MKRLSLIATICCLAVLTTQAQTQYGYVKTKGRMEAGKVIAGTRLSGAIVTVKGRTGALSDAQGNFSFPIPDNTYYLQQVQKKGYELTDPEQLTRSYTYSATNPLVIVMERPDQQIADKLIAERKIRRTLSKQLQEREQEIEALKTTQKITEAEYQQRLQKLYQSQEKNEQLISEMADRYARIDYDQLDEFNRQINEYILNGELTRADSLLRTRGDIHARIKSFRQHQKANAQVRADLEKSEAVASYDLEILAQDCYNHFEIERTRHRNDSAAYYIELRASLDTTNVSWQLEAGLFIKDYMAQYEKAMSYYMNALNRAVEQYGRIHQNVSVCYNNIGTLLGVLGKHEKAIEYFKQGLEIDIKIYGEHHLHTTKLLYNIGSIYSELANYTSALEYLERSLALRIELLGDIDKNIIECYNAIGMVYLHKTDYIEALKYFKQSESLIDEIKSNNPNDYIVTYNNIGGVYSAQKDYEKALEYYEKAMHVSVRVYGENHPFVAFYYNNVGAIYIYQGAIEKALDYLEKALEIRKTVYGENHMTVVNVYNNIGYIYNELGDYNKSSEYFKRGLEILLSILGEKHPTVAIAYNNIGTLCYNQKDYTMALEYYNKTLEIRLDIYGENHPKVLTTKKDIEAVKSKLQEQ